MTSPAQIEIEALERLERMIAQWEKPERVGVMLPGTTMTCDKAAAAFRTALLAIKADNERLEAENGKHLEELGKVIMACPQGTRTSPASDGVKQLRSAFERAESAMGGTAVKELLDLIDAPLTYDWNGHANMAVQNADQSDKAVAGRVRMLMRDDWNHESVCMLARDRIMGLSKRLAQIRAALSCLAPTETTGMTERQAALLDSQYRAGAKAGWNAQFAEDPDAAIAALTKVNPGDLAPFRSCLAPGNAEPVSVNPSQPNGDDA